MEPDLTIGELSIHALFSLLFIASGILLLFYLPRILGFIISIILNIYTWKKYKVEIKISKESISFSLIGGHILFKGFSYTNENFIIKIIHGRISIRYWIFNVRKSAFLLYNESNSVLEANNSLPCRISCQFEGIEVFSHNKTQIYDWIQENYLSVKTKDKPEDLSLKNQSAVKSMHLGEALDNQDGANLNESTSSPPFALGILKILPIEVIAQKGSIIIGHSKAPSLLINTFEKVTGTLNVFKAKSNLDLYRLALELHFENFKAYLKENLSFSTYISMKYGQEIEERSYYNPKRFLKMLFNWGTSVHRHSQTGLWGDKHISSSHMKFDTIKKGTKRDSGSMTISTLMTSDEPNGKIEGSANIHSLPNTFEGAFKWKGLNRYQDTIMLLEDYLKKQEYAKTECIAECHSLEMSYLYDEPGMVPFSVDKNKEHSLKTSSDHSHHVKKDSPEWKIKLLFRKCTMSYGPWANKQLKPILNFYNPWVYRDLIKTIKPVAGQQRLYEQCQVEIIFEDEAIFRLLHREPSKDGSLINRCQSDIGASTNPVSGNAASFVIPDFILQRVPSLFEIKLSPKASILANVPMINDATHDGYTVSIGSYIENVSIITSLNYQEFISAHHVNLNLDMKTPFKWYKPRKYMYDIHCSQMKVFFLMEHMHLVSDFVEDWAFSNLSVDEFFYSMFQAYCIDKEKSPLNEIMATSSLHKTTPFSKKTEQSSPIRKFAEYQKQFFVPLTMDFKITIVDLSFHLYVNAFNVINHANDYADNTFLLISSPKAEISWNFNYDHPHPVSTVTPFHINLSEAKLFLLFPESDTNASFLNLDPNTSEEDYFDFSELSLKPNQHEPINEKNQPKLATNIDKDLKVSHFSTFEHVVIKGHYDSMCSICPENNTDVLDMSFKCHKMNLAFFGWLAKYWDILLENYFGLDSNFMTLGEYKERFIASQKYHKNSSTGFDHPFNQKTQYSIKEKSNPLYTHIDLLIEDTLLFLPIHLYSLKNCMRLFVDSLSLNFFNNISYQDILIGMHGLYLKLSNSLTGMHPKYDQYSSHDYAYFDKVNLHIYKLYNPSDPTLYYQQKIEVLCPSVNNQIIITPNSIEKLANFIKIFIFEFNDMDNAIYSVRETPFECKRHPLTFLFFKIKHLDLWIPLVNASETLSFTHESFSSLLEVKLEAPIEIFFNNVIDENGVKRAYTNEFSVFFNLLVPIYGTSQDGVWKSIGSLTFDKENSIKASFLCSEGNTLENLLMLKEEQKGFLIKEDEESGLGRRIIYDVNGEFATFKGFDMLFDTDESRISTSNLVFNSKESADLDDKFAGAYHIKRIFLHDKEALAYLTSYELLWDSVEYSEALRNLKQRNTYPLFIGLKLQKRSSSYVESVDFSKTDVTLSSSYNDINQRKKICSSNLSLELFNNGYFLITPFLIPWIGFYLNDLLIKATKKYVSFDEIMDHLQIKYLEALIHKYQFLSLEKEPFKDDMKSKLSSNSLDFKFSFDCFSFIYLGHHHPQRTETENIEPQINTKMDDIDQKYLLLINTVITIRNFKQSLEILSEPFIPPIKTPDKDDSSINNFVSDDSSSIDEAELPLDFSLENTKKSLLNKTLRAFSTIRNLWMGSLHLKILKWSYFVNRISSKINMIEINQSTDAKRRLPVSFEPSTLSSSNYWKTRFTENCALEWTVHVKNLECSGLYEKSPFITSLLLDLIRTLISDLASFSNPLDSTSTFQSEISKNEWRIVSHVDSYSPNDGVSFLKVETIESICRVNRVEILKLYNIYYFSFLNDFLQLLNCFKETPEQLQEKRKTRLALQHLILVLVLSGEFNAEKDVYLMPKASIRSTGFNPYVQEMKESIGDPVFISRPSDLWRVGNRAFQKDQGWKLLFKIRSLFENYNLKFRSKAEIPRIYRLSFHTLDSSHCLFLKDEKIKAWKTESELYDIVVNKLNLWRHWELGNIDKSSLLVFIFPHLYVPHVLHGILLENYSHGIFKKDIIEKQDLNTAESNMEDDVLLENLHPYQPYFSWVDTYEKWRGIGFDVSDNHLGILKKLNSLFSIMMNEVHMVFVVIDPLSYHAEVETISLQLKRVQYASTKVKEFMRLTNKIESGFMKFLNSYVKEKDCYVISTLKKAMSVDVNNGTIFSSNEDGLYLSRCGYKKDLGSISVFDMRFSVNLTSVISLVPFFYTVYDQIYSIPSNNNTKAYYHFFTQSHLNVHIGTLLGDVSLQSLKLEITIHGLFLSNTDQDLMAAHHISEYCTAKIEGHDCLIMNSETFSATISEELSIRKTLASLTLDPDLLSNGLSIIWQKLPRCDFELEPLFVFGSIGHLSLTFCQPIQYILFFMYEFYKKTLLSLPYIESALDILSATSSNNSFDLFKALQAIKGKIYISLNGLQVSLNSLLEESGVYSPHHSIEDRKSEMSFRVIQCVLDAHFIDSTLSYYSFVHESRFIYSPIWRRADGGSIKTLKTVTADTNDLFSLALPYCLLIGSIRNYNASHIRDIWMDSYLIFESVRIPKINSGFIEAFLLIGVQLFTTLLELKELALELNTSAEFTNSSHAKTSPQIQLLLLEMARKLFSIHFKKRVIFQNIQCILEDKDGQFILTNIETLQTTISYYIDKDPIVNCTKDIINYVIKDMYLSILMSKFMVTLMNEMKLKVADQSCLCCDIVVKRNPSVFESDRTLARTTPIQIYISHLKCCFHFLVPFKIKYIVEQLLEGLRLHLFKGKKTKELYSMDTNTHENSTDDSHWYSVFLEYPISVMLIEASWKFLTDSNFVNEKIVSDFSLQIGTQVLSCQVAPLNVLLSKTRSDETYPTLISTTCKGIYVGLYEVISGAQEIISMEIMNIIKITEIKCEIVSRMEDLNALYDASILLDSYSFELNSLIINQVLRILDIIDLMKISLKDSKTDSSSEIMNAEEKSKAQLLSNILSLQQSTQYRLRLNIEIQKAEGRLKLLSDAFIQSILLLDNQLLLSQLEHILVEKEDVLLFLPKIQAVVDFLHERNDHDDIIGKNTCYIGFELGDDDGNLHSHPFSGSPPTNFSLSVIACLVQMILLSFSNLHRPTLQLEKKTPSLTTDFKSTTDVIMNIKSKTPLVKYIFSCGSSKVNAAVDIEHPCIYIRLIGGQFYFNIWTNKISGIIRHAFAADYSLKLILSEFCIMSHKNENLENSNISMNSAYIKLHNMTGDFKLSYLQDLLLFYVMWIKPILLCCKDTHQDTSISSHLLSFILIDQVDIHMDLTQSIGNFHILLSDIRSKSYINIDAEIFFGQIISLQSLWLSALGRLNGMMDLRILDLVRISFLTEERALIPVQFQILLTALESKLDHQFDIILVSRMEKLNISLLRDLALESVSMINFSESWIVKVNWIGLIYLMSKDALVVSKLLINRLLEKINEKISSLGLSVFERNELLLMMDQIDCPNLRYLIHGHSTFFYLFHYSFYDPQVIQISLKDLLLSFNRNFKYSMDSLELKDLENILDYYHTAIEDLASKEDESLESTEMVSFIHHLQASGLFLFELILDILKFDLSRVSLSTEKRRTLTSRLSDDMTKGSIASIQAISSTSISVSQWIDSVMKSDFIIDQKRIIGLDSSTGLYMETYQIHPAKLNLNKIKEIDDCVFYKLLTDFTGPVDLSLHLGVYKSVIEVIKAYFPQDTIFPSTLDHHHAEEKKEQFIALVPVQIEPQIKIMAEATPKLEKILEWMGLGSPEEKEIKISKEGLVTIKHTGALTIDKIKGDRKEMIAVHLKKYLLMNLNDSLEFIWRKILKN